MEWYTPQWIFEKLQIEFDLDVCAPKGGVPWIPAKHHFCLDDDGLSQPWIGKVWCNPPFKDAQKWMTKFHLHGNGVALCPVSKTKWFDLLVSDPNVVIEILPSTLQFAVDENGSCFNYRSVRSPCCLITI